MMPEFTLTPGGAGQPPSNAPNLAWALEFLAQVVRARLSRLGAPAAQAPPERVQTPTLAFFDDESSFGNFIRQRQPTYAEYVLLLLALAPHLRPDFWEKTIQEALPAAGDYPELGLRRDPETRALLPTGETALFLLADGETDEDEAGLPDDAIRLEQRFQVQRLLSGEHWLARENFLQLEPARPGEPYWSGRLLLSPEMIELFTLGEVASPAFSAAFPARQITTELGWDDLVLSPEVLEQIGELRAWIDHHEVLLREWGMHGRLRPGYRVLFYGPPGTGKTLTATLLGKYTGRKVFRIDLSTVVSKYIGETEKNLAGLFDKAQHKGWILFFDEADALFGKRTDVKDAHDRYANQEVSYLLQRVEEFDGLVILASNFKANLDEAFLRRFNAIVRFPFPTPAEREAIWRKSLPGGVTFEEGVDLPALLGRFELAGGSIVNVVQHTCLAAIARGSSALRLSDALTGIRREVEKEGKVYKNLLEG